MDKKVFVLCGDQYKRNALQFINQLPVNPDKPLLITIQDRTRTLDQNARLWATLGDIAKQVVWHGQKLSSEDWKHIFTASLNPPTLDGMTGHAGALPNCRCYCEVIIPER